jgi:ferredoxin-NADP reductase
MDWTRADILEVVDETPLDRSLVLGLPPEARASFGARPGQHVLLVAGEDADRAAFSISALPGGDSPLQVTVRNLGDQGRRFYALPAGTTLRVSAPRGRFLIPMEPERPLLLFGRGPSVAPYRALVRALDTTGRSAPVVLLQEADRETELLFRGEFERHARERSWFDYHPRVADPLDERAFASLTQETADLVVCACGENAFVDRVRGYVRERGLPKENVVREKWG